MTGLFPFHRPLTRCRSCKASAIGRQPSWLVCVAPGCAGVRRRFEHDCVVILMSADINGAARWRSRVIPALILVLFAVGALSRLNRLHLFDPDSPYYVMMARSLVELHGYSRTDDASRSAFTYRPPGMSVLLMPAAVVSPNNALVAKLTVLGLALVMLGLVYVTARDSTAEIKHLDWGALAVLRLWPAAPIRCCLGQRS